MARLPSTTHPPRPGRLVLLTFAAGEPPRGSVLLTLGVGISIDPPCPTCWSMVCAANSARLFTSAGRSDGWAHLHAAQGPSIPCETVDPPENSLPHSENWFRCSNAGFP